MAAGCVPNYGPPAPPMPDDMTRLEVPEPTLWHSTIQLLTSRDIPIKDLRRGAGWVQTERFRVDPELAAGWAECADQLQNAIPAADQVEVIVRIDDDGSDASKLHVAARFSYSLDSGVTCQSNGVWERDVLLRIKGEAEAAQAKQVS